MHQSDLLQWERITHVEGYDELITYQSTKQAVDSLFVHFHDLFESVPAHGTLRFLMDMSRTEDMPMNHVFPRVRDLIKNGQKPTRAVVITRPSLITGIISSMIGAMGLTKTKFRFFEPTQHEAAVEWLLRNEN